MSRESTPEPVRIRCAADLFSVLTNGPMEAQLAVLKSIVADPKRPIALGRHQDQDLVDLLLRRVSESSGTLKQLQILCLMSYQDPRTTAFMVEEFARSRDAGTVLRLGRRLSVERGLDFFLPFLWDEPQAQALAAARLCSLSQDLSPKERLRVAILVDRDYLPPSITEETYGIWLDELKGKHRLRARALAERSPDQMLRLWECWSEMPSDEQLWLARSTARFEPSLLRQKLGELLKSPGVCYEYVELAGQLNVELPSSLLESDQPLVRAAAIASGHADSRLAPYLGPDVSLPEVLAAAPRCTPEQLHPLLADSRWQVRALSTNLLAQCPEPPLEELRRSASSGSFEERVAAIEVLQRLGHEDWLESSLGR